MIMKDQDAIKLQKSAAERLNQFNWEIKKSGESVYNVNITEKNNILYSLNNNFDSTTSTAHSITEAEGQHDFLNDLRTLGINQDKMNTVYDGEGPVYGIKFQIDKNAKLIVDAVVKEENRTLETNQISEHINPEAGRAKNM